MDPIFKKHPYTEVHVPLYVLLRHCHMAQLVSKTALATSWVANHRLYFGVARLFTQGKWNILETRQHGCCLFPFNYCNSCCIPGCDNIGCNTCMSQSSVLYTKYPVNRIELDQLLWDTALCNNVSALFHFCNINTCFESISNYDTAMVNIGDIQRHLSN